MPEVTVEELEKSHHSLPMTRTGSQRFRVVCLRIRKEGRGEPETIQATPPLSANFAGPTEVRRLPNEMIVTTRDIQVTLPATADAGGRRGEFELRWPGGQTLRRTVAWHVAPHIGVSPSGLVVKPEEGRVIRSVVLRSNERRFRITGVSGTSPSVQTEPYLPSSEQSHHLRLRIDPAQAAESIATNIRIGTDHPEQPSVMLSVLILPTAERSEQ